jgi:CheY-like chemotaxis protein
VIPIAPVAAISGVASPSLKDVRVLLVEDDPDTRGLLEHLLRERGAEVGAYGSAEDALDAFAADRPDVIVSDIGLPGMDGVEFLRRVAESCGDDGVVPSLALTASGSDEDRRRALDAGFAHYACKPFDPEAVVQIVGRLATVPVVAIA